MKVKAIFNLGLAMFFMLPIFCVSCIEETDTASETPQIEILLPLGCDTLYFGQSFIFRLHVVDSSGLGNISLDVHNNFGHHDHGTGVACEYDEVKEAVNPYYENWIYELPDKKTDYVFEHEISIPLADDENADYDTGDYHFHMYVTDNDGYQSFTTFDVKMLYVD